MTCKCGPHATDPVKSHVKGLSAPWPETKQDKAKAPKFRFSRDWDAADDGPVHTHRFGHAGEKSGGVKHEHLQMKGAGGSSGGFFKYFQ